MRAARRRATRRSCPRGGRGPYAAVRQRPGLGRSRSWSSTTDRCHVDTTSIAVIGTGGAPGQSGGLSTAIAGTARRPADRDHQVVVCCRTRTAAPEARVVEPLGLALVRLSSGRSGRWRRGATRPRLWGMVAGCTDAALVLNTADPPLLLALRAARVPVTPHVDGLQPHDMGPDSTTSAGC
jgi:hypothetical protein